MIKSYAKISIVDFLVACVSGSVAVFLNILLWFFLGSSRYLQTSNMKMFDYVAFFVTGIIITALFFIFYIKLSFNYSKTRQELGKKSAIFSAIIFLAIIILFIILLNNPVILYSITGGPWGSF
jgi:hypothetical protein